MDRCDSRHRVVDCRKLWLMFPPERNDIVFKANQCFSSLGNHVVKDCTERCACRRCKTIDVGKHFFICVIVLFLLSLRVQNSWALDKDRNGFRNSDAAKNFSFPVHNVTLDSIEAALNQIVAARALNQQNEKCKLVYCQQDVGSRLTIILDGLVKELRMDLY